MTLSIKFWLQESCAAVELCVLPLLNLSAVGINQQSQFSAI